MKNQLFTKSELMQMGKFIRFYGSDEDTLIYQIGDKFCMFERVGDKYRIHPAYEDILV